MMGSRVGAGQCMNCYKNTGRAIKRDDRGDIVECTACPPPCEHKSWDGYRGIERDHCYKCNTFAFEKKDCVDFLGHVWNKQKTNIWLCQGCSETVPMLLCPSCERAITPKESKSGITQCKECKPKPKPKPEPEKNDEFTIEVEPPEDILTPEEAKTEVQAYRLEGKNGEEVKLVYAGRYQKNFDQRCQTHADKSGYMVRMDRGIEVKFYRPGRE